MTSLGNMDTRGVSQCNLPSYLALLIIVPVAVVVLARQVCITPSYMARSAPVEVIWANIKNPIAKLQTHSMTELKKQVLHEVRNTITEKTWLGAYRTTRVWEDSVWEAQNLDTMVEDSSVSVDAAMEDNDEDEVELAPNGDIIVAQPQ